MAEPTYKKALRKSWTTLVKDLESDELLDQFMESEFLTTTTIKDLRDTTNRSKRNRDILDRLMMSGPKKYEKFKECLKNTKQEREAEREAEGRSMEDGDIR